MRNENYQSIALYIGVLLILGMFLTLFTIIATFTAWGTVLPISDSNVQAILRSKVGMHVLTLPNKLATTTIYVYLTWLMMLLWKLLPYLWGILFTVFGVLLYIYLNYINSGLARVIIDSKAMQDKPIFSESDLRAMHPEDYDKAFIEKVRSMHRKTSASPPLSASMAADQVRNQYVNDSNGDDDYDDDNNNNNTEQG